MSKNSQVIEPLKTAYKIADEKKDPGVKKETDNTNWMRHTDAPTRTSKHIAEQSKVSYRTVERAEKFADAVDKVAENTGINPQEILSYTL